MSTDKRTSASECLEGACIVRDIVYWSEVSLQVSNLTAFQTHALQEHTALVGFPTFWGVTAQPGPGCLGFSPLPALFTGLRPLEPGRWLLRAFCTRTLCAIAPVPSGPWPCLSSPALIGIPQLCLWEAALGQPLEM